MSDPAWLLWLLQALPLVGGVVLAVAGRRVNRAAPAVAVGVAAVALVLACLAAVTHPHASVPLFAGIPATAAVDGLSAVMVVTVTAVTLAVMVFSVADLGAEENRGRFFGLLLIFVGAMLVTVTASTLALLVMSWELMGAASYALIGFWWREPRRVSAANTAFLTTRAGDLGLYVAAGAAVAGGVHGLALADLAHASSPWLTVITLGVVLAAFGKSAQLPFSFWLSRAMEGPSPVSALLHSATMVAAGAYLLLRLHPLLVTSGWGEPTVAGVGVATALGLGLVAVFQTDLKQLLAASTCAQVGFMVLAAGSGGVSAGLSHLVAHAATKSLLFLAAGAWLTALGTKQLAALRGAARRYRTVGVTFTVGAFALAGLPPASLWLTKDELLAGTLRTSPALYAAGLAAAVVAAVYSTKAVWYVWQPIPAAVTSAYDTERRGTRRVSAMMRAPLIALAVLAAVLGVLALPVISGPLKQALGVAGEPSSTWWQLILSAGLALVAAAFTWWWGGRSLRIVKPVARWLARWLDLEHAAHILVVRPTLACARALAVFDDRVIDGAVKGVARGGVALARTASRVDDGDVDGSVRRIAAGAGWLGQTARRPQTGQLHTYYAQAAAAFVVLTLFFVLVR